MSNSFSPFFCPPPQKERRAGRRFDAQVAKRVFFRPRVAVPVQRQESAVCACNSCLRKDAPFSVCRRCLSCDGLRCDASSRACLYDRSGLQSRSWFAWLPLGSFSQGLDQELMTSHVETVLRVPAATRRRVAILPPSPRCRGCRSRCRRYGPWPLSCRAKTHATYRFSPGLLFSRSTTARLASV